MKKILSTIIIIIITLSGCKKDITSLNVDTKHASKAPAETLFSNAQKNLSDRLASSSVNDNIFRLIMQQWTQTVYTDETKYDLITRKIPDGLFVTLYRDVLRDLAEAKELISNKNADVKANQLAIADIMQIYTYHILVSTFGNIPYQEALNYLNITPKYDDAKTIELDLLAKLDADIAALKSTAASYGSADLIYSGNISSWKKFASTLKLKLGMMLADDDPAMARRHVETAVTNGVFTSNADNALFKYMSVTPNTNPLWVDLVESGRNDFVVSETIINKMNDLNDPRRPFYFTEVSAGVYKGGKNGETNNYQSFSHPSSLLTDPTVANVLLDYSETEFLLAEAVERGFAVGGTAQAHYESAIKASISYWGGTDTDATTYLAQPTVDYTTAAGSFKQKIGEQKWIALYNRGFDAWTEWRRLDFPQLTKASGASTDIPLRFTYPIREQNLNGANYSQASSALGGDRVTTKLFWDKF